MLERGGRRRRKEAGGGTSYLKLKQRHSYLHFLTVVVVLLVELFWDVLQRLSTADPRLGEVAVARIDMTHSIVRHVHPHLRRIRPAKGLGPYPRFIGVRRPPEASRDIHGIALRVVHILGFETM